MHDQTLLSIVLVVVAIATTVQALALVRALQAVRRFEARFVELERELRELRPRLERLGRVIDNVADWSAAAAEHIPRVAADIENTLDQLRGIVRLGAMVLVKPLRPLGLALALWKGVKGGAHAYRRLRPAQAPSEPQQPSLR
jgi:ABC-type protease/lipase transport system fused ATPase/permease subunit